MTSKVINRVARTLLRKMGGKKRFNESFRSLIRQALDEVIDFPRTGRRHVAELEKTEKTYIGTKVEILSRKMLGVSKGNKLDLLVAGVEVDAKFSVGTGWMIPMEAINEVCLVMYGNEEKNSYGVGLLHMTKDNLTASQNRDLKRSISAIGRKNILWLASGELPRTTF